MFVLNPRLEADSHFLLDLSLCQLRLINDRQFPWFILVPRRSDIREVYQLAAVEQAQLWRESAELSAAMMAKFSGDKLNLAAIGNLVPQLHLHHVVRYAEDPLWPDPIWGRLPMQPYAPEQVAEIREWAKTTLS